jgi:DNA-directed RNA polymerase specialized sigma subunit
MSMFPDPSSYLGSGSLGDFVLDASATPVPDADEEWRLASAARGGDEGARDVLIRAHLRLVVDVAIALRGEVPTSRLIPAGLRALVQAVDGFDPARHGSFRTFARPLIRREMRSALFQELAVQV